MLYSVELKLRVEADSPEELKNKIMGLNNLSVGVQNWAYGEIEDNTLSRENVHVGKVVKIKEKNGATLGVIEKVNTKNLVVTVGNGKEYNCSIEGLMDVTHEEFKEEELKIGRPNNYPTYSGFIGYILKDNSLAVCFENRDRYDIILIDTNGGTTGRSYKGIMEKDIERYIKFTK